MHRLRIARRRRAATLFVVLLALTPDPAGAVSPVSDPDGFSVGVTLGGASFLGLTLEYGRNSRSIDVTVGTWAFRDVSLSVVGKHYLGPGGLRPYFGLGLWGVATFGEGGSGAVLAARAPVGVDWRVLSQNHLGAAMNINRGLWVRRTDPGDDTPLNTQPVPLPGFYYRWRP